MNALTVLLLCLAAACALPIHFPTENTVIYNYHADVKTGINGPAHYASQFALSGQLHIERDVSDPTLNNAYSVKLNNVKFRLYNGKIVENQLLETIHELGEATQQLEDAFLIVYDEHGKFQGIKVPETESGWSKNMKQGIASMLQLDLSQIELQTPMKPHSFITHENTLHGTCEVSYDVHSTQPVNTNNNVFVVTKSHDLKSCSHFVQRVFDHVECKKCHVESVDDMTTSARRVFEIEQQDNNILIRHLVAYSDINYVPYNARSEAHYLWTNTTLDLHSVVPMTQTSVVAMNVQNLPVIRDITFNKPLGNYALHAAEDLTHGRHIVKLDAFIPKLKKMLAEAADYIEEDHLEVKEPDWKHGQTINRLQHTMSYMDLGSLEQVYNAIQEPKTPKEVTMKNIFLRMVPTVGTTAACLFTRNVVRKHKVPDTTAVAMLIKLPTHVKVPSERLLLEMEELLKLGNTQVSPQVRKTSILCFSILVRKTFMHQHSDTVNPLLERYLHRFLDHVKKEQSYEMKMVYMMAIKNVKMGNIEKLLEPIIRGELLVSENPHHIRIQAMWAIKKAVEDKVEYTHNLFWPILIDVRQPLLIRMTAYDILMNQMPNMQRLLKVYWFMNNEQNDHLYNYHYTNLKGLANSVDPCLTPIREMVRMVLRYTRIRPVNTPLSSKQFTDYTDPIYEHGESWNTAWVLDELTGLPHAGYMEHQVSLARKPVDKIGVYWSVYGLDEIMKIVKKEWMDTTVENLSNKNVQNVLTRAAQDMPAKKHIQVDICIALNGHVVVANHYDQDSFKKLFNDVFQLKDLMTDNIQEITYDTLYEMQIPTDMGLQGVFSTKMPQLWSVKYNNVHTEVKKPSMNMKLEVDARLWRHGEYVMSVYNPIVDVWHSVRRAVAQDVAWPVEMNFIYNHEAKSLKVTVPRLPHTKFSQAGIRYYVKNLVTVTEDEQDALKICCATCHHHTVATTGEKRNYHAAVDSKDMGLRYSSTIFDCESTFNPVTDAQEWHRVLSPEHKNTGGSWLTQYFMGVRQKLVNDYIRPEMGNCGMVVKMEPSIIYPTSQVDLNVRVNVENVDHVHDKMHTLSSNKINVRGTLDAKAASTNESVRSWDVNVNIDMSQGHVVNNVKVQVTRETPGEKKLKICVDAQKNYPNVETDYLKLDNVKEETTTKMTVTAGLTDDDKCVRDDMLITMTVKGEMTEEQKRQMTYDNVYGSCVKDVQNLQYVTKQKYVPKTMNCLREAMRYTTMKKYTVNTSWKKVPVSVLSHLTWFDDYVRASYLPYMKHKVDRAETGNAKVVVEFPSDLTYVNATVVTPVSGYEYTQVPLHQEFYEGMTMDTPITHPEWHVFMDNTRLSVGSLYKITQGQAKICTVYPQVLITLDEGVIPFVVSDKWTLLSGDHIDQTYAVFVKSMPGNKLAVKVYVAGHEMEIIPKDNVVVTVDGNVVEQHEKGVVVPKDEPRSYAIKLTETNEHLVIQSQRVPVLMLWTPNSVTLMMDTTMQGQMTGMCGHMDGTHKEKLPKIYTMAHL